MAFNAMSLMFATLMQAAKAFTAVTASTGYTEGEVNRETLQMNQIQILLEVQDIPALLR